MKVGQARVLAHRKKNQAQGLDLAQVQVQAPALKSQDQDQAPEADQAPIQTNLVQALVLDLEAMKKKAAVTKKKQNLNLSPLLSKA